MPPIQKESIKTIGDDTIRTRIDPTVKARWESWCSDKEVNPSQALRWLISMHLNDPGRLWKWLAEQEQHKINESDNSTGGGKHGA